MDSPEGSLVGDMWRATPRGWRVVGILVLLGLAAWGVSTWVEGSRRARLRAEIEGVLAALPPVPPEPAVAAEDDAAPVLLEAFAARRRASLNGAINAAYTPIGPPWMVPPPAVVKGLEDNAEAFRLLEAAVAKPSFAVPPASGAPADYEGAWDLASIAQLRALVELRGWRVPEAVSTALIAPRMFRRIGPGRSPPWSIGSTLYLQGSLEILEAAVADARLDASSAEAILRHLPSGEELRASSVADFETQGVRDAGKRLLESLGDDGEAKARARGWRPPTLHQRLAAVFGKGGPSATMEAFPTASGFRAYWEAALDHRAQVGLRGPETVRRLAAVPAAIPTDTLMQQYADSRARGLRTQFALEARLDVVRAAAAARLFEMRKGRAPASLAELVPEFLPVPGRDPFTEAPLLFEPAPDGWEISSAGPGVEWTTYGSWKDVRPSIRWGLPDSARRDAGK